MTDRHDVFTAKKAKTVAGVTYGEFFTDVLALMRIAPTLGNLRTFGTVVLVEGPNSYWNPMNWTLPYHGSSTFNSAGVQMYQTYVDGIAATATGLLFGNSVWDPFVASLVGAEQRTKSVQILHDIYLSWGDKLGAANFLKFPWTEARDVLLEVMPS